MAWIESHKELLSHPKTLRLCDAMGLSVNEGIGILHRFWWWCSDYCEDGDLRGFSDVELALAVGVDRENAKRFVDAMVEAGFLDRAPYFRVHDWLDYAGRYLYARYHERDPKKLRRINRLYRSKRVNPKDNPGDNPRDEKVRPQGDQQDLTGHDRTGPEEKIVRSAENPSPRTVRAKAFLDLFHRKYLERWGKKPSVNRYDVRNLATRVASLGNGDGEALIETYFAEECYVGHPLQKLYQASVWDRMRGKLAGEKGLGAGLDYFGTGGGR